MNLDIDSPDLLRLLHDLGEARAGVVPAVKSVVTRGALNIKTDAKANAPDPHDAKLYRSSITYDVDETGDEVTAEIGPDKERKQGALGNLFEFGGKRGAAKPHLIPAWEAEEPKFVAQLGIVAEELLE